MKRPLLIMSSPPGVAQRSLFRRLLSDNRGTTAMEYGIIGLLISVAIIASVTRVGNSVSGLFNKVAAAIPGTP